MDNACNSHSTSPTRTSPTHHPSTVDSYLSQRARRLFSHFFLKQPDQPSTVRDSTDNDSTDWPSDPQHERIYVDRASIRLASILCQNQCIDDSPLDDNEQLLHASKRLLELGSGSGLLLSVLLSTSIIERSLAFFHSGTRMKDYLASPQVLGAIGEEQMHLLRLVVGSPLSLNVRNLAWHGFLAPSELPQSIAVLLYRLAAERNTIRSDSPTTVPELQRQLATFNRRFLHIHNECLSSAILSSSSWIPERFRPFAQLLIDELMTRGHAYAATAAALVLLELVMRRRFCHANALSSSRLCSTDDARLFTTFDEILLPRGKLLGTLSVQLREMLLDLLKRADGPRLRDRISHLELDPDSIDLPTARSAAAVLAVAAAACPAPQCSCLADYTPCFNNGALAIDEATLCLDLIAELASVVLISDLVGGCDSLVGTSALPSSHDFRQQLSSLRRCGNFAALDKECLHCMQQCSRFVLLCHGRLVDERRKRLDHSAKYRQSHRKAYVRLVECARRVVVDFPRLILQIVDRFLQEPNPQLLNTFSRQSRKRCDNVVALSGKSQWSRVIALLDAWDDGTFFSSKGK